MVPAGDLSSALECGKDIGKGEPGADTRKECRVRRFDVVLDLACPCCEQIARRGLRRINGNPDWEVVSPSQLPHDPGDIPDLFFR
jgi:hypothetical protein